MCKFDTSFAYLFWLANNKEANIQRSVWATVSKLGMWIVVGRSTTKCAYLLPHLHILFWLANNSKGKYSEFCLATVTKLGMWVVVGRSTTHMVCGHWMHIFNTSFAYLFWLAYKKNISRVLYGLQWWNVRGIWVVVWYKNTPCVPVITKCAYLIPHLQICHKKANIQSTSCHSSKGGPRCIFSEYGKCINQELRNSRCFFFVSPELSSVLWSLILYVVCSM